jgi:hypothetical protein
MVLLLFLDDYAGQAYKKFFPTGGYLTCIGAGALLATARQKSCWIF